MDAKQLEKKLESIEKAMVQRLFALASRKGISLEQLGRTLSTNEFKQLFAGLGLEQAIQSYAANYDVIFAKNIKGFAVVEGVAADMQLIKELQLKILM